MSWSQAGVVLAACRQIAVEIDQAKGVDTDGEAALVAVDDGEAASREGQRIAPFRW